MFRSRNNGVVDGAVTKKRKRLFMEIEEESAGNEGKRFSGDAESFWNALLLIFIKRKNAPRILEAVKYSQTNSDSCKCFESWADHAYSLRYWYSENPSGAGSLVPILGIR